MKIFLTVAVVIAICITAAGPAIGQNATVTAPKLVAGLTAFAPNPASGWDAGPTVFFSRDGRYVLAFTGREAKAWRMPEGELVYRFNTSMMKDDKTRGVLNYMVSGIDITSDGKYIYARGGSGQDFMMMPANLETGELLRAGPVRDSIKSGMYQLHRGVQSIDEVSMEVLKTFWGRSSPLVIKRSKDGSFDDALSILGITADPDHPGELIICFQQTFCGSRSFINENLTKSVKDVRKAQYSSNGCHFFDVHASRYNPATRTAVYLGNILKGNGGIDFTNRMVAIPSPLGDVIYLSGDMKKTGLPFQTFNTPDGNLLWEPSKQLKGQFQFKGFNEFGFAVFTIFNEHLVASDITFEPLTGKQLSLRVFSSPVPKNYVYNAQWNVTAAVTQMADKNWGIGLYNGTTGEHMLALTDQTGAAEIAAKTSAEIDRINAYIAASQKALRDAWDRQIAENARAAQAAQEKKSADAAYRAAHFKPCPLCSGSGVWVNSGVAKAFRRTSYSEGRALDGSRTLIKSTESSTGGYWEQRSACLKCHGRGEVAR